jgi:hypothetical protein
MKWTKEKLIYIILIYINFNFILRLIEKSMCIKNFNYAVTSLLFFIGFLIYWFYDYILKKGIYKVLFTVAIFGVSGMFYLKQGKFVNDVFNYHVLKNINILNDLIYEGETTYFYQYKFILILVIPLITALILWITFKFMKKFILMVSLGVVITLWFSNCYTEVKAYLFLYLFISLLTFIIMNYIKRIQQYKDEGVKVSLKFGYILVYGVVVSLIISKTTIMLPQQYKGRDLSSFGNYFENKFATEASETSAVNKDKYSLATSGYSGNDKRLGGPITLNYKEIFKVKSDKPYYLKGNVKDFYDGNKWTKANETYYKKVDSKVMEFIGYGKNTIGIKNSMTIYPDKKFRNNTIFVPNYAFNISGVGGTLFYDKAPMVLSEKTVTKDYSIDFYGYNEVIDTIEDVREYEKKLVWENDERNNSSSEKYILPMNYFLKPKYKDMNTVISKNSSVEEQFVYRNSEDFKIVTSYGEYLQVPERISDRIYDLVRDITKDSYTTIDKVLAIKEYLTKNYVYDLEVSEVPEDSEFIDYFLFKEKKGYCTYFNTTMTIMCRLAGVPARYVEGFKTPSKKDDRGLYSVTNAEAHAWCEVLLGASEYSNMWTIADASPTASEDMQRKLKEFEEQQKNSGKGGYVDINNAHKSQKEMEATDSTKGVAAHNIRVLSEVQFRVVNILTAVILFVLIRIIKVAKRRGKVLRSHGVVPLYNYYLHRLAVVRIVKPEYQSDLEFAQEISDSQLKGRMGILVQAAYEEFYGKHSVVTLNNKEYYEFLEEYLKEYQGTTEYLLKKYLGEIY